MQLKGEIVQKPKTASLGGFGLLFVWVETYLKSGVHAFGDLGPVVGRKAAKLLLEGFSEVFVVIETYFVGDLA